MSQAKFPLTKSQLAQLSSVDVISVQPQVIFGSVGNNIALPVLLQRSLRAVAVPTCILSSSPDYPEIFGGEIPDEWVRGFLSVMKRHKLTACLRGVIVGYLCSADKAWEVADWLTDMRRHYPDILIIVDPALGDDDTGFYVEPTLSQWYRSILAPLATGLTPNLFELSWLCGQKLSSERSIISAARSLLGGHTRWVAVTSSHVCSDKNTIGAICVTEDKVFISEHTLCPDAPKGTGDLFTAELTSALLGGLAIEKAFDNACRLTEMSIKKAVSDMTGLLYPVNAASLSNGLS